MVKKGSKMRSWCSSEMPQPVSETISLTAARPSPGRAPIVTVPPDGRRLERVHGQGQDHLLHLGGVADDVRQVRGGARRRA